MEGDRQRLAFLVDEIVGAVVPVFDLEHILALVAVVRAAFVDDVAPALVERRGSVRERKLRLLGLKAACEEEADRREKTAARGVLRGVVPWGERLLSNGSERIRARARRYRQRAIGRLMS
jgi:hypothetical protein